MVTVTTRTVTTGGARASSLVGRRQFDLGHSYFTYPNATPFGWNYADQTAARLAVVRHDSYASGGDEAARTLAIAKLVWNEDGAAIGLLDCHQNTLAHKGLGTTAGFTGGLDILRADLWRILSWIRNAWTVLVMEQCHLQQVDYDYLNAAWGPYADGSSWSDAAVDAVNTMIAEVVGQWPNAVLVPVKSAGFDPSVHINLRHPSPAGYIFLGWQIDAAMLRVVAPTAVPATLASYRDLPGLWMLLDPASSLWAHPADGALSGTVTDGSGNGRNFSNAIGASQPLYIADGGAIWNHRPILRFGSGPKWLGTSQFANPLPQPSTLVAIYKSSSTTSQNIFDGIDSTNRWLVRNVGITARRGFSGVNLDTPTSTITAALTGGSKTVTRAAGVWTTADVNRSISGTGVTNLSKIESIGVLGDMTKATMSLVALSNQVATTLTLGYGNTGEVDVLLVVLDGINSYVELNGVQRVIGDAGLASLLGATVGVGFDHTTAPFVGDLGLGVWQAGKVTVTEKAALYRRINADFATSLPIPVPVVIAPVDPPALPSALSGFPLLTAAYAAPGLFNDGAAVAQIPDASGHNRPFNQLSAPNRPTFDAAGFSNQPAFRFAGNQWAATDDWGSRAQPHTLICLAKFDLTSSQNVLDGILETSRHMIGRSGVSYWQMFGGTALHPIPATVTAAVTAGSTTVTAAPGTFTPAMDRNYFVGGGVANQTKITYVSDTQATLSVPAIADGAGVYTLGATDESEHLFVSCYNGATSWFDIDGVRIATGDAGSQPITGLTFGASFFGLGQWMTGTSPLAVAYDGVITAGDYDLLKGWARDTYPALRIAA